jgi:quinoprotein glucose dehydrogenase
MATLASSRLTRVHSIWGLGQLARRGDERSLAALVKLLRDRDGEVRAQAAKVVGEAAARRDRSKGGAALAAPVVDQLGRMLADPEPRARFHAAIALGHAGDPRSVEPLAELARANGDADADLRHAAVIGLVGCAVDDQLLALAGDSVVAVRRAALLAMRRRGMPQMAALLDDPDRSIVVEAARAIHDTDLAVTPPAHHAEPALEKLARALDLPESVEPPLLLRAINANLRLGGAERAERLVRVAVERADLPEPIRVEALAALAKFDAPPARDRLLGVFRPCTKERCAEPPVAAAALRPRLGSLLMRESDAIAEIAARFVEANPEAASIGELREVALDRTRTPAPRIAALDALANSLGASEPQLRRDLEQALSSEEPKLRAAARRLLAKVDPELALGILDRALQQGAILEGQGAFATLGTMEDPRARALLASSLDSLLEGRLAPELELDLLLAAETRKDDPAIADRLESFERSRPADDPLAKWRECRVGGDPERGRRLFLERNDLQCTRCHRVGNEGAGEAGPDLAGVGRRAEPGELLESIALPNKKIAAGYGSTVFVLKGGDLLDGRVIGETETHWHAVTSDLGEVRVRKSAVASSRRGLSAMPAELVKDRRDLRDLVAWLSTLR